MKRILLSLVILSSVVVGAAADAGPAAHWGGAGDRTVTVIDSVSGSWDASLVAATTMWSGSPFLNLVVTPGKSTKAYRGKCPYGDNAIRVCNANYGPKGWAGLAQYSYSVGSGHITRARARLNTYYVKSEPYKTADACHEIGHTLGLGHRAQGESGTTCMTPTLSATTVGDATDLASLAALHNHAHAFAAKAHHPDEVVTVTRKGNVTTVTHMLLAPR